MSSEDGRHRAPTRTRGRRWWQTASTRASAAVLAAGALATAITAIVALGPDPDPANRATITSVALTPEPLSGYVETATLRPLQPRRGGNLILPQLPLLQPRSTESPVAVTSTEVPVPTTEVPVPTTEVPVPTTEDQGALPPIPSVLVLPKTLLVAPDEAERRGCAIRLQPVLSRFYLPPCSEGQRQEGREPTVSESSGQQSSDQIDGDFELVFYDFPDSFNATHIDQEGNPLPPEIAAQRLAAHLETVRKAPYRPTESEPQTPQGTPPSTAEGTPPSTVEGTPPSTAEGTPPSTAEGTPPSATQEAPPSTTPETRPNTPPTAPHEGQLDLLGMRATVNMELEGLRGESLALYWRLSPATGAAPLPAAWGQAMPACLLRPSTQLDSASVDIWRPLPDAPGPFLLDFILTEQPEGARLTNARTDPFN
jgi:hypothetical protein